MFKETTRRLVCARGACKYKYNYKYEYKYKNHCKCKYIQIVNFTNTCTIQIKIGSECSIGLVKYHVQRDTGADVQCIQQAPEPREISKSLTSLYFQQAFAASNTQGQDLILKLLPFVLEPISFFCACFDNSDNSCLQSYIRKHPNSADIFDYNRGKRAKSLTLGRILPKALNEAS